MRCSSSSIVKCCSVAGSAMSMPILLAATRLTTDTRLWTRDRTLNAVAGQLGLAAAVLHELDYKRNGAAWASVLRAARLPWAAGGGWIAGSLAVWHAQADVNEAK